MKKQKFFEKIKGTRLEKYSSRFAMLEKKTIAIYSVKKDENDIAIGASKAGGKPDLPENIEWPVEENGEPLYFVAQINLHDVSNLDSSNLLPKTGILYFFYTTFYFRSGGLDVYGVKPEDKDKFKIIYSKDAADKLQRRDFPSSLPAGAKFQTRELTFIVDSSFSDENIDFLNNDELLEYNNILMKNENRAGKMLGYASVIQDSMEFDCELVTHGMRCDRAIDYNDPSYAEFIKNQSEWLLLLEVVSGIVPGMEWGDMGNLYFWIKRKDLQENRFDKAWMFLQSY